MQVRGGIGVPTLLGTIITNVARGNAAALYLQAACSLFQL